ncbi:zinc-binding alcohol dehydrogenase family protein [Paracoccus laeviglucosivorans]|uniref:2-desacetyl-2-hydroxyethyl bacteriochlorophyllide A dehydrogenase n=1 Tax=Paracoccus laeviglucosivorans TaxID=1197861 RepID=K7ZKU8_9RHOB|nr:zinc-binding alcohol dehydrogenase family protein [Paracoccus laeviglucosivorans]BAM68211.1 L-gluconate dehydrogenase lgnH [Paracoccus laeviglucosivorans]SMO97260.1 2-desacetyl-2-hydroxyethyl bacteriochlorophyllide A dehydrogenase [Paracoccus laeviglucosivorans]
MKALIIEKEGHTVIGEISEPDMGARDVRIRVRHVGLCGTDFNSYRGFNPLVTLPRVPGHEIGGEIIEVGSDVPAEYAPDRRVVVVPYTNCGACASCRKGRLNACRYNKTLGVQQEGGLTREIVVPMEKVILNDTLAPQHLALVEPLAVGFHAVARGQVAEEDTVVVLGCGMIGMGVLIGCVARGARVIAVDMSAEKLDLARKFGAEATLNPTTHDVEKAVSELTADLGADVVFEAVGTPATFTQCITLAGYAGRVVYVGYSKAPVSYDTAYFNLKELDILGSRNATMTDFQDVIAHLETIGDAADLLISKTFPFAEADQAFPYWTENRDNLKVMVAL